MNDYKRNALNALKDLISYRSVKGQPTHNAPFGAELKNCLDAFLECANGLGFATKNVDGYAGHVEWKGKTDEIVGILGHLDVVPEGEGWLTDPYTAVIKDGYMYGRGVLDDKGPTVACLYAMKELKDGGFAPNKTIRLIVGCDEENGSSCMRHYFSKERMCDVGFSPDAEFPAIHCEKATLWLNISLPNDLVQFKNVVGGEKANVVPSFASCDYYGELPPSYFEALGLQATGEGDHMKLAAIGKNGHGSTPWVGENALWKLFKVISGVEKGSIATKIYDAFCLDHYGESSNIASADLKSGVLTQNFGVVSSTDDRIILTVDLRFPLSTTKYEIIAALQAYLGENAQISVINEAECLFVDPEGQLVKTLMNVYKAHTGSSSQSLVIGGGTYAKEMKYGIAFGPLMEDEQSTIHMPNERMSLENFSRFYDIYKDSIKELSK